MKLLFNPSGTHVKRNIKTGEHSLLIRMDWIPSELDAAYKVHHVYVPVIGDKVYTGKVDEMGSPIDSDDYQKWLDSLPHIWRVNPCLCEFITVPETVCKDDIDAWAELKLDRDTPATLDKMWDDYRTGKLDRAISHSISPYFRDRGKYTTQKVLTKDYVDLVASVNERLAGKLKALTSDGIARTVEPESIDVGSAAIDRSGSYGGRTFVAVENTANATGTIDSIEVWCGTDCTAAEIASFYVVSGTNLSTRGSIAIGAIASGSKQTFTAPSDFTAFNIESGDMIGGYFDGYLDYDTSGSGYLYVNGDGIPCTNLAYTLMASRTISLYATGTESGGATYEHSVSDSLSATDTIRGQKIYQAAVVDNMTGSDAGGRAYVALPSVSDTTYLNESGDTIQFESFIDVVDLPFYNIAAPYRVCQTFTSYTPHYLTSVQFYLRRIGGTGDVTVALYNTNLGEPIGEPLASTTVAAGSWSTSDHWRSFTLPATYINYGTTYGIVAYSDTTVVMLRGKSTGYYPRGSYVLSTNNGTTWFVQGSGKLLFQEFGYGFAPSTQLNTARSVSDIVSALDSIVNGFSYFRTVSDIAAHSDSLLHEFSMNPTVSDSVHMGMTSTTQLNGNNSITDIAHLLETLAGSITTSKSLSDSLTLNDLTTAGLSYLESVADSLALSDKPWAARWLAILLSLAKHHRLTITPDNQLAITHLIELPLKLTQTVKDEA